MAFTGVPNTGVNAMEGVTCFLSTRPVTNLRSGCIFWNLKCLMIHGCPGSMTWRTSHAGLMTFVHQIRSHRLRFSWHEFALRTLQCFPWWHRTPSLFRRLCSNVTKYTLHVRIDFAFDLIILFLRLHYATDFDAGAKYLRPHMLSWRPDAGCSGFIEPEISLALVESMVCEGWLCCRYLRWRMMIVIFSLGGWSKSFEPHEVYQWSMFGQLNEVCQRCQRCWCWENQRHQNSTGVSGFSMGWASINLWRRVLPTVLAAFYNSHVIRSRNCDCHFANGLFGMW